MILKYEAIKVLEVKSAINLDVDKDLPPPPLPSHSHNY